MERAKVAISQDANVVQLKLPGPSFKAAYEILNLSSREEGTILLLKTAEESHDLQGWAKKRVRCCENVSGKLRQKCKANLGTKPEDHFLAYLCM